jgi:hypothetical protein
VISALNWIINSGDAKIVALFKVILTSSAVVQVLMQTLNMNGQVQLISNILNSITTIEDVKLRRSFSVSIVEEILAKRPFAKTLVILLVQGKVSEWFDRVKLARECLKHVTGEDLR